MKKLLLLCFIALCNLAGAQNKSSDKANADLHYKVIKVKNNMFGYDIYDNKHVLIHQPSIPGIAGNDGFKTEAGAEKVAQLVIKKIKKGLMPPTVSKEEMQQLQAIP